MKPYFAKYLRITGPLNKRGCGCSEGFQDLCNNYIEGTNGCTLCPDKALFLCSRELIASGVKEQLKECGDSLKPFSLKQNFAKTGLFKVIGKIPSHAKWIKEGDEFEEDDVHIYRKFVRRGGIKVCNSTTPVDRIEFCCPTCKAFH